MKRKTSLTVALAIALGLCGCKTNSAEPASPQTAPSQPATVQEAASKPAQAAKPITVQDVGLQTPESVLHWSQADIYLVANINGSPLAKDGNGFISKVSPDGTVQELKWIDGTQEGVELDAPKGMAIQNDTLYVADITQVRLFELPSGKQKASIAIAGASFVNDIAPGADGSVLVSDSGLKAGEKGFEPSGSDAVYRIDKTNTVLPIAKGSELGRPNGLLADNGTIYVVTFGSGEFYRLDAAGKRQDVSKPPKGSLDGIVKLNDGSLLLSSWDGSALYRRTAKGEFQTLPGSFPAPADIDFDQKRGHVLIPLFTENKLVFVPVQ